MSESDSSGSSHEESDLGKAERRSSSPTPSSTGKYTESEMQKVFDFMMERRPDCPAGNKFARTVQSQVLPGRKWQGIQTMISKKLRKIISENAYNTKNLDKLQRLFLQTFMKDWQNFKLPEGRSKEDRSATMSASGDNNPRYPSLFNPTQTAKLKTPSPVVKEDNVCTFFKPPMASTPTLSGETKQAGTKQQKTKSLCSYLRRDIEPDHVECNENRTSENIAQPMPVGEVPLSASDVSLLCKQAVKEMMHEYFPSIVPARTRPDQMIQDSGIILPNPEEVLPPPERSSTIQISSSEDVSADSLLQESSEDATHEARVSTLTLIEILPFNSQKSGANFNAHPSKRGYKIIPTGQHLPLMVCQTSLRCQQKNLSCRTSPRTTLLPSLKKHPLTVMFSMSQLGAMPNA